MLTLRQRDWFRAHTWPIFMFSVEIVLCGIGIYVGLSQGVLHTVMLTILMVLMLWATVATIRQEEMVIYAHALIFQKWQDHEIPDVRETDHVEAMIRYCQKRKIRHRVRCFHGVPFRIDFLYEEDMFEAKLAV